MYNPDGSLHQHLIYGDGRTFLFGRGSWQPKQGAFTPESEAALPAYETIAGLDESDLLEASFLVWENAPCVFVSFRVDDVFADSYWLSLDDGLPFRMERSADGEAIYRCTRVSFDLNRPEDDVFLLPNKQLAWEFESS